ncbi:MAG: hypothetical protein WBC44_08670 [Planctomycetaceae bacterium]
MIALRLLLNLTLVVTLAVVCPIRCQAESVRVVTGGAAVETDGCPCCPGEATETPEAPAPDECSDCVCDGAVDGPKVAALELPPAIPGDLPAATDDLARLTACSLETLDERPDAPDGATLRLLLASLVI